MPSAEFGGFPNGAPEFLAQLAANNSKAWFDANRARYDRLLAGPAKECVGAIGELLRRHVPDIHAEPRSIMRINRDIRFAKDKRPYKDWLGLWFWEGDGSSRTCPGFYLGLDPKTLTLGAGMHQFDADALTRYRQAVVDPRHGKSLRKALKSIAVDGAFPLGGQRYKRVPRGFDGDHPNAALLLHGGLYAGRTEPHPAALFTPGVAGYCVDVFAKVAPLHRWLVTAMAV